MKDQHLVTLSVNGYRPTKVPGGILNLAVNPLATCWSTLSRSELRVPVWLQEPVDPSTVTSPLGGEEAGGDRSPSLLPGCSPVAASPCRVMLT